MTTSVHTQTRSYLPPPGLQAQTRALPGRAVNGAEDEKTPELLGAPTDLLGSDRLELSERSIELLGAAKGLPGEGSTAAEPARPGLTAGTAPGAGQSDEGGQTPVTDPTILPEGQEASPAASDIGAAEGHADEAGQAHIPGSELQAGEEEAGKSKGPAGVELDSKEQAEVDRLKDRDREVRTHEHAHAAAGGQYVRGGISYEYATGPDGKRYAVGGEVSLDTSPVSGDPQATILKAQTIRRAAMAPAQPSGQDRSVAASASRLEAQARQELLENQTGDIAEGGEEAVETEAVETDAVSSTAEGVRAHGELAASGGASAAQTSATNDDKSESGKAADSTSPLSDSGVPGSIPEVSAMIDPTSPNRSEEGPLTEAVSGSVSGSGGLDFFTDDDDDESAIDGAAPATSPPVMRLDYGPEIQTGQLFDVTR